MRNATSHRLGSTVQRGFTLVELLVALTLGLLVAAAAVAALIVGRQGFASVDSSSQLRENGRYAASAIELAVIEAGFQNEAYGVVTASRPPGIRGYTNSLVGPALASLPGGLAHDTRTGNCGQAVGTACANGSDVLVVNFWGASRGDITVGDGTMVDCAGNPQPQGPGPGPNAYSIISVATGSAGEKNAEPALVCTYLDLVAGVWKTVPIVQGVESFRVLYGTFGVTAGTCAASPTAVNGLQTAADTYLTAKQMDGAGGYCPNNWARIRSVRVGLLLRGPVGSATSRVVPPAWQLLGSNFAPPNSPNDAWATLTTAADGRVRQQLVFTIHIRNPQS